MKQFMPQAQPSTADPASGGGAVPNSKVSIPAFNDRPTQYNDGALRSVIPQNIAPMWAVGTEVDISVYVSPSIAMPKLSAVPHDALVLEEKGFKFGDYKDVREVETSFTVPPAVQRNATLFAHFYVAKSGSVLDPNSRLYDKTKAYHMIRPLTWYHPKKKVHKTRNLLSDLPDTVESEEEKKAPKVIASYYHPNFTLSLVPDAGVVSFQALHPGVREFYTLDQTGARDATGQNGWYYPVLFTNTFWQLKKDMVELNETVTTLPFNVKLNNLAHWKFNLFAVSTWMRVPLADADFALSSPWKQTSGPMRLPQRLVRLLPRAVTALRWRCSRRSSSTATRTSSLSLPWCPSCKLGVTLSDVSICLLFSQPHGLRNAGFQERRAALEEEER